MGGAGFDAEDARFSCEFVGIGDGFCDAVDFDLARLLACDEGNGIAAHRMDGETCDIGSGGVTGLRLEI